ncbi:solute carrier family 2, facilitated glucose transporter member 5-like isoform X1 [Amphiura filiformis]|uniref:solute carrier family 2, facilitated glucose transporter member 5-like isoform X1 n=1 Tax=Amphiura filiformis TaxID=82378 RepID=UPI003B20F19E
MVTTKTPNGSTKYSFLQDGKLTPWLLVSTISATVGCSLQFGYGTGVMAAPSPEMKRFFNQSNYDRRGEYLTDNALLWLWSFTVSFYCVGGALGAYTSSYLADRLGRRNALVVNNVFSIIASIMFGVSLVANNYEMIMIARIIYGFYAGTAITVVPLYLSEISPVNLRGAIGTCHQLMTTLGILISQVLGLFALPNDDQWPIVLALTGVFSVFNLVTMPFCPESPRWFLINKNKPEKAREALERLRGAGEDIEDEIQEMKDEAAEHEKLEKIGVWEVITLKNPDWKMPLIICMMLHAGQQLSGINAIFFYLDSIYRLAGMTPDQVAYATVGTGAINVIMTVVSVAVIERAGRRFLLLLPFFLMAVFHGCLTVTLTLQETVDWLKWLSMAFIFLYIIAFAIGPGPVPFVIVPELWAQAPRPAAMSISVQTNWFCNFVVGITFSFIQESIEAYTFLVFMVFCLITSVFIFFFVPETKGKTFDEVVDLFRGKSRSNSGYEMEDKQKV